MPTFRRTDEEYKLHGTKAEKGLKVIRTLSLAIINGGGVGCFGGASVVRDNNMIMICSRLQAKSQFQKKNSSCSSNLDLYVRARNSAV